MRDLGIKLKARYPLGLLLYAAASFAAYAYLALHPPQGRTSYAELFYPLGMNYTIVTAYLYGTNRLGREMIHPYCVIRYRRKLRLYVRSVRLLLPLSAAFALAQLALMLYAGGGDFSWFAWAGIVFGLCGLGALSSMLTLLLGNRLYSFLALFLALGFDCMVAAGYFPLLETSAFYSGLTMLALARPAEISLACAMLFVKGGLVFGIGCLLFAFRDARGNPQKE